MFTSLSKKIEFVANLAIILVACLLAVVLVKNLLLSRPGEQVSKRPSESQLGTGTSLSSLDIDWKRNGQTLVLAVSSTCHFCTDSAPFYKRVAQSKSSTDLVAVLPQPTQDGQEYLKRLGVPVDEVKQMDLEKIGVRGTPTLLLVDNSGTVKKSWVGKLPPEQEAEVLSRIQSDRASK